jgi:hypothetical protein
MVSPGAYIRVVSAGHQTLPLPGYRSPFSALTAGVSWSSAISICVSSQQPMVLVPGTRVSFRQSSRGFCPAAQRQDCHSKVALGLEHDLT